jgi:hypothetical protein
VPYTKTTWVDHLTPINAANLQKLEDGVATAQTTAETAQATANAGGSGGSVAQNPVPGLVMLDSFPGATDDDKHAAAKSYAAAQTYVPLIGLGNRAHTFNGAQGQPYKGWGLWGPQAGWPNREQGVQRCTVTVTVTNGPWIDHAANGYYGYTFGNIDFVGGGTTTQFFRASNSANPAWKILGHNLGFQNFKGVFGNSTENCYIDLCTFTGPWSILSPLDTAMRIGGADALDLWTSGTLNIGGGSTGPVSNTGGNRFLLHFSGLSKCNVANIYCTADNAWRGLLCTGSMSSGYGLQVSNSVFEGRNASTPGPGNMVRVEGGAVNFRGVNVNCGMAAPAATGNANGKADRGLFEVVGTDTQVTIDGMTVSHAAGITANTPVVYVEGTPGAVVCRVRNVMRSIRSGGTAWETQLPVAAQSTSGLILDRDTSTVAA